MNWAVLPTPFFSSCRFVFPASTPPSFPPSTLAHLARCAAAILLRAATDVVRFGAALPFRFGLLLALTFAQRALLQALDDLHENRLVSPDSRQRTSNF